MRFVLALVAVGSLLLIPAVVHAQSEQESVVPRPEEVVKLQAELSVKQAELHRLEGEIAAIRARLGETLRTVSVQVAVMEISRTKLRANDSEFAELGKDQSVADFLAGLIHDGSSSELRKRVDKWQEQGLVKTLAEPTMTTAVGRPTCFLVGGQIPILVALPEGGVAIEYKDYGTRVDLVVNGIDRDWVDLQVHPRISKIDESHSVKIGDTSVPSLVVREIDCRARGKLGETICLGGQLRQIDAAHAKAPAKAGGKAEASTAGSQEQLSDVETIFLLRPQLGPPLERSGE